MQIGKLQRELPIGKLSTNIDTLKSALRKVRLYNQALQEAILIVEEKPGISILNKSGTKPS